VSFTEADLVSLGIVSNVVFLAVTGPLIPINTIAIVGPSFVVDTRVRVFVRAVSRPRRLN
jgi:hypothetical protein